MGFQNFGFQAVQKYFSKPVSTTIAYRFGDDGNGNIRFPAVTICLRKYLHFSSAQPDLETCASSFGKKNHAFEETLKCFRQDDPDNESTTTKESGDSGFPDLFTEGPTEEFFYRVRNFSNCGLH